MWVYLYPNNTETELKNAYIGEYHEIICNFTQGDQWFNLDEVHGWATSWRDGNGFYIKSGYSWWAWARLLIPSTITSVGTPKMIKLYWKNMNVWGWVWISEWIDSKCIRVFGSQITCSPYSWTWAWGTPNNTNVSPLNEDVFVIDFENGICYLESSPNITVTIYPSTILTLWNNDTLNLCLLSPNKNNYGYLQKAEFYF